MGPIPIIYFKVEVFFYKFACKFFNGHLEHLVALGVVEEHLTLPGHSQSTAPPKGSGPSLLIRHKA